MKNEGTEEPKLRPDTIIISGFARLPENMSSAASPAMLSIDVEVDPQDGKVVDCSCSLPAGLAKKILSNSLLGREIEAGVKGAVAQIEKRFFSVAKRAIIATLEDVYRNYHRYLQDGR
jgi:hypothetical protein